MKAPDGFGNDSSNYAFYAKTRKKFDGGDFAFGWYMARSGAFRPLATPVSPLTKNDSNGNPTLTDPATGNYWVSINGYDQPGPAFSQQTTGFYTTLPGSVNFKYDTNAIKLFYGDLNVSAADNVTVHNLTYFVYENRVHWTPLHDFVPGSESAEEVNHPSSFVMGDKPVIDIALPYNDISVGGFIQGSRYHSREQLFNPSLGFVNSPTPPPAGLMGSAGAPNGQYFSDIFEQYDMAAFIQDTIRPIPTLAITPGVRYIHYITDFRHNEADEFPLAVQYNPGGQLSQFPSARTYFDGVEPSIGLNWEAFNWLAYYASWGRSYRQPENGGGTGPYVALPASAVQLERGDHWQGGAKMRWAEVGVARDVSVDVSYYHLDYKNETIPTALASGGALLAFGSSKYDGVNFFADGSPYPNLYAFANVGIVNANFTSFINGSGTFSHVPVPNTPNANYNLGVYYRLKTWRDIMIEPRLSWQHTGGQHIYDNSKNITSDTRLPSFDVVNLSTQVNIPLAHALGPVDSVQLGFEVDNLLDNKYNSFEYVSAGGLYGAGGTTNPTTVGAGSTLALPGAPRAFYFTAGLRL